MQAEDSNDELVADEIGEHSPFYFTTGKRQDFERYKHFYNVFVRQIVGKKEFDASCRDWSEGDAETKISTVSDEALALLCFENQIEVWKDVWEKSQGQIRPVSKNEEYPQEWISTKTTKYTTKYDAKGMPIDTKDKTWTASGIDRFNVLFREVQEDRKKFPNFIEDFIDWKQSTSKKSSGSVSTIKDSLPDVDDDLFYNPDNLNKDSYTPDVARKGMNTDEESEDSEHEQEIMHEDDSDDEGDKDKKPKSKVAKRKLTMV